MQTNDRNSKENSNAIQEFLNSELGNAQISCTQQKHVIDFATTNIKNPISLFNAGDAPINCSNENNTNKFPSLINSNVDSQKFCMKNYDLKDQSTKSLSKKPFSIDEDNFLSSIINMIGEKNWVVASKLMKQGNYDRNPRQCRDRYYHYLDPKINKSDWTKQEDELLMKSVEIHGKKWKMMEKIIPGRSEVSIRNRYNLVLRKKMKRENGLNRKHNIMSQEFSFLDNFHKKSRKFCIGGMSKRSCEKNKKIQKVSEESTKKDKNITQVSFDEKSFLQLYDDDNFHELFKLDEIYFI